MRHFRGIWTHMEGFAGHPPTKSLSFCIIFHSLGIFYKAFIIPYNHSLKEHDVESLTYPRKAGREQARHGATPSACLGA